MGSVKPTNGKRTKWPSVWRQCTVNRKLQKVGLASDSALRVDAKVARDRTQTLVLASIRPTSTTAQRNDCAIEGNVLQFNNLRVSPQYTHRYEHNFAI